MTQANEMKELPFNEGERETEGEEARQQIRHLLLNVPSLIQSTQSSGWIDKSEGRETRLESLIWEY